MDLQIKYHICRSNVRSQSQILDLWIDLIIGYADQIFHLQIIYLISGSNISSAYRISSLKIITWSVDLETLIGSRDSNSISTQPTQTSSGRLKKVTTSYYQTRRRHDVWKITSDLRRLEDVWFTSSWRRPIYDVLKTSDLRRLQDVWFTTSWRRLIYVVLKTSNLWRLENVWFTTSSGSLIYDVLKTLDLRCLEDVQFTTSWRRLTYDVLNTSDLWRLEDVCKATLV